MFARTVCMQLKPNSVAEFTQIIEKDIIPLLRTQPGFQDEIVFVVPDGTEAVAKVVEGAPQVSTYEVANSTYHTIAASVAT
jgi:hypothetical protein